MTKNSNNKPALSPEEQLEQGILGFVQGRAPRPKIEGDLAYVAARALRLNDAELTAAYNASVDAEDPAIRGIASRIDAIEDDVAVAVYEARQPGVLDETDGGFVPGSTSGNSFLVSTISYGGSLGGGTPGNSMKVGH